MHLNSRYVGGVLEEVSRLTGVTLKANAQDGAADNRITVHVENLPLASFMEALWALVSYRGAEYRWKRGGTRGDYTYILERPLRARDLGAALRRSIQESFERDVALLLDAANLDPEDREQAVRRFVDQRYNGSPDLIAGLLGPISDSMWLGLRLFSSALTPEQQRQVLQGKSRIRIPVQDFPESIQSQVTGLRAASANTIRRPDGTAFTLPPSRWVEFRAEALAKPFAPSLWIDLDGFASAVAGGTPLNSQVEARLNDLWMFEGESPTGPEDERVVSKPANAVAVPERSWDSASPANARMLDARLTEFSRGASVSVIGRLPDRQLRDPGIPYNQSIGQFVRSLRARGQLMAKWHDGILLVTSYEWYREDVEAAMIPWTIGRRLAIDKDAPRALTLDDLALAASKLSDAQIKSLMEMRKEFGVVSFWPEIFALCGSRNSFSDRLRSEKGLALNDSLRFQLFRRPALVQRLDPAKVRALRMRHDTLPGDSGGAALNIEYLPPEGAWKPFIRIPLLPGQP